MEKIIYKKILVTHDGSKLASVALPHALFLAESLYARLLLLRVIESVGQEMTVIDPMGMNPPVPAIGENAVDIVKEDKKRAQEQLMKLKIEIEKSEALEAKTAVLQGSPGLEIVRFTKEQKIDLVIMSTHGRSGLGRALLGSVTDYVIRHASCPVLVVNPIVHK